MTASEITPDPDDARSIAERALDLFVYLPAGAVLTALEDAPTTVAKGRARVDQELRNAKVVGRFVVDFGWRQLKGQFESIAGGRRTESGAAPDVGTGQRPAARSGTGQAENVRSGTVRSGTGPRGRERHREPGREPATRPRPSTPSRDPDVDRAIPDYDILAASQVVRRLDGLGHDELRAVVRHERATRGRRTILHRAEQLLGTVPHDRPARDPVGPDGSSGGASGSETLGKPGSVGTPGDSGRPGTAPSDRDAS